MFEMSPHSTRLALPAFSQIVTVAAGIYQDLSKLSPEQKLLLWHAKEDHALYLEKVVRDLASMTEKLIPCLRILSDPITPHSAQYSLVEFRPALTRIVVCLLEHFRVYVPGLERVVKPPCNYPMALQKAVMRLAEVVHHLQEWECTANVVGRNVDSWTPLSLSVVRTIETVLLELRLLTTPEPNANACAGTTAQSSGPVQCEPGVPTHKRLVLRGRDKGPIVLGKEKGILTNARYDVVEALLAAGERGLTKDQLDRKSGHTDARKLLKAMASMDPDWAAVLSFPGMPGGVGYRAG